MFLCMAEFHRPLLSLWRHLGWQVLLSVLSGCTWDSFGSFQDYKTK